MTAKIARWIDRPYKGEPNIDLWRIHLSVTYWIPKERVRRARLAHWLLGVWAMLLPRPGKRG